MRRMGWLIAATIAGGCGGEFILVTPDVAAPAGSDAAIVVRLQRREFWRHAPPLGESALTFQLADGPLRAARTDKAGYAAVALDLPDRIGRYDVAIHHQDTLGDTVSGTVSVYVLDPDRPAALVDLDSLPTAGKQAPAAARALTRIAQATQVVYGTHRHAATPAEARRVLAKAGFPPGPVLPYAAGDPWYTVRRWRDPQPVAADFIKRRLPNLRWGIAAEDDEAEAFLRAGLTVVGVGAFPVDRPDARKAAFVRAKSWADLTLPPVK